MTKQKISQKRAKELRYLEPLTYSPFNHAYGEFVSFNELKQYLPSQLEPRGEPMFIKGSLAVGLSYMKLRDKIDKIIKKEKIDADAFVSRICRCDTHTVVQLYKIKK